MRTIGIALTLALLLLSCALFIISPGWRSVWSDIGCVFLVFGAALGFVMFAERGTEREA